jgi:serine/threonine protein kinase
LAQALAAKLAHGHTPFLVAVAMGCSSSVNHVAQPGTEIEVVKDFHDQYLLGVKLGRGAFAQVRSATKLDHESQSSASSAERAVKILDLRNKENPGEPSRSLQKAAFNEATVWKLFGTNKHCVRLYDLFYTSELCYMVMEKCSCGLLQHFEAKEIYNERFLGSVLAQMVMGIAHIHTVKVVHRDVKPDNFLVGGDTIKLGDFGLSCAISKQGKVNGVYGTAPFMCPEMLGGRAYDLKADVWSLGVIAYVLLFGNFPYMPKEQSSKGMKQAILEGAIPPKYEPTQKANAPHQQYRSENIVAFTRSLLEREPEQRPESADLLNTTFVMQAMKDSHAAGVELPSLRPVLREAKKVGAFEVRDPSRETSIDGILHSLQMKRHGTPLPENKPGVSKISAHGDKKDRSISKDWIPNSSNRSTTCSRSDMGVSTDSTTLGISGTRHGSMVWSKGTTQVMTPSASRPIS